MAYSFVNGSRCWGTVMGIIDWEGNREILIVV
jgi:hypothetical protein